MEGWQYLFRKSLRHPHQIQDRFGLPLSLLERASQLFPIAINPYWLQLIQKGGDPLARQVLPSEEELADQEGEWDPLEEGLHQPVATIIHRYPNRVLFLVSNICPIYCRFCTRRRKVGKPPHPTRKDIRSGLDYIKDHTEIKEVILSGGDPLMLSDKHLASILRQLRAFPHVDVIRIGSRMPVALPQRITLSLCRLLQQFHPLYVVTHFNHPLEITPWSQRACERLVDHGIPVENQTVLLKGINDSVAVLTELFQSLIRIRVRPYYLHQLDRVRGATHFEVPVERGVALMKEVQNRLSGLAVPRYVQDDPKQSSKVVLA